MHIDFTEEQNMLRESGEKYLRDNYDFEHRQSIVKSGEPFSVDTWNTFAELGWLMLPFAEEDGGLGGGPLELMLMGELFGRHLVIEPYLETVVQAGGLLRLSDGEDLKAQYLEPIMTGALQGAFAYAESACGLPASAVTTTYQAAGDEVRISGDKTVVYNGPAADIFIVTAAAESGGAPELFLVPADADGLVRRDYATYDGRAASELRLDGVTVPASNRIADRSAAPKLLKKVGDLALIYLCAEALGAMEALLKATIDYTAQRKQFGQPIAKFQVLRHRMVDMFIETELCRSLLMAAAWHLHNDSPEAERLISALKAKIGKSSKFVSHNAIQLHGGIGVTDELSVGHYFKRLAVIDNLFGARDFHLARFQEVSLQ